MEPTSKRRQTNPPVRLGYTGRGEQSEDQTLLGIPVQVGPSNQKPISPKSGGYQDTTYLEWTEQQLRNAIQRDNEIINIAKTTLKSTEEDKNYFENKDENECTSTDWEYWIRIKRDRANAVEGLRQANDRLPRLMVAIKRFQEQNAVKNRKKTKSVAPSSKASTSTRVKLIEIDTEERLQKLRKEFEFDKQNILDHNEDIQQNLLEAQTDDAKLKLEAELNKNGIRLKRRERDYDNEKKYIEDEQNLKLKKVKVEEEDEQEWDEEDNSSFHLAPDIPFDVVPPPPPLYHINYENDTQPNYNDTAPVLNQGQPFTPMYQQYHHQPYYVYPPPIPQQDPMRELATAIRGMTMDREWEPRDLPIFNGAAAGWLIFKGEFTRTTPRGKENTSQNLIRLRKALKGSAFDAVTGLLNDPRNVTTIMSMLQNRFGRNDLIIDALLQKVESVKAPDALKASSFVEFATAVLHLFETVKSMNEQEYLNDKILLNKLVQKLPTNHAMEWMEWASRNNKRENLETFSEWIKPKLGVMERLSKPVIKDVQKQDFRSKRGSATVNATVTEEDKKEDFTKGKDPCACCGKTNHKIQNCFQFKKDPLQSKLKIVKKNGLCFLCLNGGHLVKDCKSTHKCNQNGCGKNHHSLLHAEKTRLSDEGGEKSNLNSCGEDKTDVDSAIKTNISAFQSPSKPMSVVKVKVISSTGNRNVYALLDSGSDSTIIDSKLAEELGLTGQRVNHLCKVAGGGTIRGKVSVVNFQVSGIYKNARVCQIEDAVTLDSIGLSQYTQNATDVKKKYSHLRRARLQNIDKGKIQLIIGEDHPFPTVHLEVLKAGEHDSMAKRTLLGWVLAGKNVTEIPNEINVNAISTEESLESLMRSFFSVESYDTFHYQNQGSVEDQRALKILETTMVKVGKTWECGLLWKNPNVELPQSYHEALSRLKSNERRMERNPEYAKLYREKIDEYIEKGYVRELTPSEIRCTTSKTFYLPHFGVTNVNKPGKMRLVFDAASKTQGKSLNDFLLVGPDLIRPLTAVLMNFRLWNVVMAGDIQDMFHRVGVREEDQNSQRFLWRDPNDKSQDVRVFAMKVLIFGAKSSPSSAIYAKNANARQFNEIYPEAAKATVDCFYCDDGLLGSQSVDGAIKLRAEVTEINKAGNFILKKWLSNSQEVLNTIPSEDRADQGKPFGEKSTLSFERILGVWWMPQNDNFTFSVNFKKVDPRLLEGDRPTKRQACSVLMSVYDPLGFIANYKIKGIILLQRMWRSGILWDELVTDDIYIEWRLWIDNLRKIENVSIPRIYAYDIHLATKVELHTLVDASEEACSTVTYLRVQVGEDISVSFVSAKTKVAPTKKLTIPRLELLAAVLGAKNADNITQELQISIHQRFYWCDSRTVLQQIRSETLRYKEFLANRVGRIHELSSSSEWRWIPSALNVADEATRLKTDISFTADSFWLQGPIFLKLDESQWPIEKMTRVEEDPSELKISVAAIISSNGGTDMKNLNDSCVPLAKFSSFSRLVRAQGAVLAAARIWKSKLSKQSIPKAMWTLTSGAKLLKQQKAETHAVYMKRLGEMIHKKVYSQLTPEILDEAEQMLVRIAQQDFEDDVKAIQAGTLRKSSKLWAFSPYIDEGIIRMKGRIDNADVSQSLKFPIILPNKHTFTELLIEHEHVKNAHQSQSTVLNNVRQKYWILQGRAAVRRVTRLCKYCHFKRIKPIVPIMGNLPSYRLHAGEKPFHFTGVDLFGPLEVTVGRHHEKRWVCLFTCMVVRAVHLEVVHSLNTDSTMMAINRFISEKGRPVHVYSDNGRNFVGANKEIKQSWGETDWNQIVENMQGIHWHFAPPYSPHFGGAWERMVQLVKRSLKSTLKEKFPKDEVLLTLVKEAGNIVNSRPMTYLTDDPTDLNPLTPNHFMRGSTDLGPTVVGNFEISDEKLRHHWRQAQGLVENFWDRWKREVLPELARRSKWHENRDLLGIGDLVFLVDDLTPRNVWKRGVITQIYPGKDAQVRVVEVETGAPDGKKTTYRRGVDRIIPLGLKK